MRFGRALLYALSLGAAALGLRSAWLGPPSLVFVLGYAAVFVAALLASVLVLDLGTFCEPLRRGPPDARGVALTFDDGPHPEHTRRVLALLAAAGAKATFFVVGRKAEAHPDVVREMVEAGHAVGLHSYAHPRGFAFWGEARARADVSRGLAVLEPLLGRRPTWFRPPIGHTTPPTVRAIEGAGLRIVGWSVRALDGLARTRPEDVVRRVVPALEDGAVVLLHDAREASDDPPAALAALPRILDAGRARGLAFVALDAWEAPAPTHGTASPRHG